MPLKKNEQNKKKKINLLPDTDKKRAILWSKPNHLINKKVKSTVDRFVSALNLFFDFVYLIVVSLLSKWFSWTKDNKYQSHSTLIKRRWSLIDRWILKIVNKWLNFYWTLAFKKIGIYLNQFNDYLTTSNSSKYRYLNVLSVIAMIIFF